MGTDISEELVASIVMVEDNDFHIHGCENLSSNRVLFLYGEVAIRSVCDLKPLASRKPSYFVPLF
jgi:hypothetical protein